VWRAWDVFGQANGTADDTSCSSGSVAGRERGRPCRWTAQSAASRITQPVFLAPDDWIPVPTDWSHNIVSGRGYDLTEGEGLRLWTACLERAAHTHHLTEWTTEAIELRRHGQPQIITPHLGQTSFRLAVLDAYDGACAVTDEHSLPVLEGRPHPAVEGRRTARTLQRPSAAPRHPPPLRPRLRHRQSRPALRGQPDATRAYANGKSYYALDGCTITAPTMPDAQPSREVLEWHSDVVFRR
jgi:putative restriction endonuclease